MKQQCGMPRVTRAEVLARVGAELADQAATVKSLQSSLGPVLDRAGGLGDNLVRDLQDLDRVEQVLASLAALMAAMLPATPASDPDPLEALLDRVPLAGLASRLRGAAVAAEVGGDLDLF